MTGIWKRACKLEAGYRYANVTSANVPLCAGLFTVDVRSVQMRCLVIGKYDRFHPRVECVDCFFGEAAASTRHEKNDVFARSFERITTSVDTLSASE